MAKHKNKHGQSISVPELMQLAEEALARPEREGAVERALEWLRSAEGKLRQTTAPAGKKVSVPPHLVAARAALPGLVARAHFLLARKAADLSQLRAALGEAAARAPEKADYLLACGAARLLAGEEAQADGDFARAAALQPEMAGAVRTSRAVALGALACGHGRQANEALAAVPETDRDAGWHRLATICGEFGGPEGRLAGVHGDFSTIAALARLAAGDRAAAAPVLEAPPVLDHNPSRIEAAEIATRAFHAGALRIEDGRLAAGLASFRTARQLVEAHCLPLPWVARMPAWCHLAAERAFVADRALAMEFWTLARALAPNDKIAGGNLALARRALAAAAWRDGDFERAAALWQEALSTSPDDEQVLHPLALALERLNRKADALAHWRSLARIWRRKAKASDADPQLRPRVFALEDRILQLMIELDRPEQEISAEFEEALKVDPGNLIMRRRAADYLLEIGRGVQALKHLQQIEQQQGPSAEITTRRAVALASLKRTNEAIEAFNRALAFDPPDSAARPAYLLFLGNLAEKAEDKKEYPRAVQFCEQQLHLDPAYLPAFVHLARLSFSMEKKETAEAYIRRALDIAPENAGLRVRIGAPISRTASPKRRPRSSNAPSNWIRASRSFPISAKSISKRAICGMRSNTSISPRRRQAPNSFSISRATPPRRGGKRTSPAISTRRNGSTRAIRCPICFRFSRCSATRSRCSSASIVSAN
ncbi:MAG: hypothetical protein SF339_00830 [Blastocatellia bacterium]|nr:hypothetical protein [Blastocatellia bacterium]